MTSTEIEKIAPSGLQEIVGLLPRNEQIDALRTVLTSIVKGRLHSVLRHKYSCSLRSFFAQQSTQLLCSIKSAFTRSSSQFRGGTLAFGLEELIDVKLSASKGREENPKSGIFPNRLTLKADSNYDKKSAVKRHSLIPCRTLRQKEKQIALELKDTGACSEQHSLEW